MSRRSNREMARIALLLTCFLAAFFSTAAFSNFGLGSEQFSAVFGDGSRDFCTDQSLVNISWPTLDSQFDGFETAESAAAAFAAEIRATADVPQADPEHAHLLADALAPSKTFHFTSSVSVEDQVVLFDLDVESDGVLEARLVVETLPNGRFAATTNYICDSVLVEPGKDFSAYYEAVEEGE